MLSSAADATSEHTAEGGTVFYGGPTIDGPASAASQESNEHAQTA
jgi:hypothetical protein